MYSVCGLESEFPKSNEVNGQEVPENCKCAVKGCHSKDMLCVSAEDSLFVCTSHVTSASKHVVTRLQHTLCRARAVQALWEDEERFDRAVQSGKYLKLCSVLGSARDAVDRAWKKMIDSATSGERKERAIAHDWDEQVRIAA